MVGKLKSARLESPGCSGVAPSAGRCPWIMKDDKACNFFLEVGGGDDLAAEFHAVSRVPSL